MSSPSTKKEARIPIVIGIVVVAGAIAAAVVLIVSASNNALNQQPLPENPYPSIEIEMPKTIYQVGERLDFTVHTYGICASPNVYVWREDAGNGQAILVYQHAAAPISCPPPQEPGQPHLGWRAEQLVSKISDNESFGRDGGDSVMASSAAFFLNETEDYTISASLPDKSKSVWADFTVVDAASNKVAQ